MFVYLHRIRIVRLNAMEQHLVELLDKLPPISLSEMKDIKLMNRVDKKYLATISQLEQLLVLAQGKYMVQQIDGKRYNRYHTIYLDTPDEEFDADAGRIVKDAVDAYIEEYKKFPSSRTMESLDIKYDQDKGRFYRKYRPFVDKCKSLVKTINPSGYGRYDAILLKMRDRLNGVDYNFPYGWKNH